MTILWWQWLVIGLALIAAELTLVGGFYVMFFGVGALLVGALAAFDLAGPMWMQLLLFSVFSVASLLLFRNRLLKAFQRDPQLPPIDSLVGEVGIVADDLLPGAVGQIELRGTAWSARNAANATLSRGSRCRVVWVEGVMVHVEPEGVRS
jgi:membrane protein implicated in regulation of membrane protease activity